MNRKDAFEREAKKMRRLFYPIFLVNLALAGVIIWGVIKVASWLTGG